MGLVVHQKQLGLNLDEVQKQRHMQINELDEIRQDAFQNTILVQNQRSKWHDKFIKKSPFSSVIGPFFFILDLKFLKENLRLDG